MMKIHSNPPIQCYGFKNVAPISQDLNILAEMVHKMAHGIQHQEVCYPDHQSRKRNPSMYQYTLLNEAIPRTECYKYLGINISKDLRWNTHCQSTLLKANKTLGLLRRTLSPCSKDVKARAYQALVRPQLERMEQKPGIYTHPPQYKDWNRYRNRLHVLYIVTTGEAHLPLRSF